MNLFIHLPFSFLENYNYILYPCWVSRPSITQPSISNINQIKQRLVLPLLFIPPCFSFYGVVLAIKVELVTTKIFSFFLQAWRVCTDRWR